MPRRIGIDLGGTKIEGILLDGHHELARSRVETPRGDYGATLTAITNLVRALEQRIPDARPPIPTVGVGIPGTISSTTGLVKNANSTWLIGRPLAHDLEARVGRPVRVANDANCFAISESTDGAAAGASVVFGVIIGTGVGGGVVVDGRIVPGVNGVAGEWGHNPLPWRDEHDDLWPPCYCGKHGCIETFLSGPAVSSDHSRRTGIELSAAAIEAAARAGDAAASDTLGRYERRMARALASVINILDPDVIVLGGGVSNVERLYENVPRLWSAFIFAAGARAERIETRLLRARHGASSGVRGAAWLWGP